MPLNLKESLTLLKKSKKVQKKSNNRIQLYLKLEIRFENSTRVTNNRLKFRCEMLCSNIPLKNI